jgi:hypothetical protein
MFQKRIPVPWKKKIYDMFQKEKLSQAIQQPMRSVGL